MMANPNCLTQPTQKNRLSLINKNFKPVINTNEPMEQIFTSQQWRELVEGFYAMLAHTLFNLVL